MMGGANPDDDEGSLDSDSDLILDGENDSEDSDDDGNCSTLYFETYWMRNTAISSQFNYLNLTYFLKCHQVIIDVASLMIKI